MDFRAPGFRHPVRRAHEGPSYALLQHWQVAAGGSCGSCGSSCDFFLSIVCKRSPYHGLVSWEPVLGLHTQNSQEACKARERRD